MDVYIQPFIGGEGVIKLAYYGNEAYDFSLFEQHDYGTSAPKYNPQPRQPQRKRAPDRVNPQPRRKQPAAAPSQQSFFVELISIMKQNKPSKSAVAQTRISAVKALKTIALALVLFSMISSLIYCRVTIDNIGREITTVDSRISEAKSEQVRLQTQLDSMISLDKVEDYAVNVLGMVKLENYKITYFNVCDGDRVVFSGNKEYK